MNDPGGKHRPALDLELGFIAGSIWGAVVALFIMFLLHPEVFIPR